MPIPDFETNGLLPPGIYLTTLPEIQARYEAGSAKRHERFALLRAVVEAARHYASIKRVLVWGSFVTVKPEPDDLDYSIVVSVDHARVQVAAEHRRFFQPAMARQHYGADTGYLVLRDYPLENYLERLDFMCQRDGVLCGILEIHLHCDTTGEQP